MDCQTAVPWSVLLPWQTEIRLLKLNSIPQVDFFCPLPALNLGQDGQVSDLLWRFETEKMSTVCFFGSEELIPPRNPGLVVCWICS